MEESGWNKSEYSDFDSWALAQIAYYDMRNVEGGDTFAPGEGPLLSTQLSAEDWSTLVSAAKANGLSEDYFDNWRVSGMYDTNESTGLVCTFIQIGDDIVAPAFRGSEPRADQLIQDWIVADVGLLNSTLTVQQDEIFRMMNDPAYMKLMEQYGTIIPAGHSLGGNDAFFFAIMAVRLGYADKIPQCFSLDGPGFSNEFLEKYAAEIEAIAPNMYHTAWSFVGNLLNPLPIPSDHERIAESEGKGIFAAVDRHSLSNVKLTNGSFVYTNDRDGFSNGVGPVSRIIDDMPEWLFFGIGNQMGKYLAGGGLLLLIPGVALGNPVITVVAGTIYVVTLVAGLAKKLNEIEFLRDFAIKATEFLAAVFTPIFEKIGEIKDLVLGWLSDFGTWVTNGFNRLRTVEDYGDVLKVNTDLLYNIADRLSAVNRRLSQVDRDMDDLYWRVGWSDLKNLITADLLTGKMRRISSSEECLRETAKEFVDTENKNGYLY